MDVHIHYARPPDREEVFHQRVIHQDDSVIVTLAEELEHDPPMSIPGHGVVLERGSDVVWCTFPGVWHDVGRFHDASGAFTGWYANILTPPTFHEGGVWHTTDLFLDVWLGPTSDAPIVLDRDQFEEAVDEGWVDARTRERALEEVEAILAAHSRGEWPPSPAIEWTLERARATSR